MNELTYLYVEPKCQSQDIKGKEVKKLEQKKKMKRKQKENK